MITGDDSKHRAALLLADPPYSDLMLRVPVRIRSGDKEITGDAMLDTGAALSAIAAEDWPSTGETVQTRCAHGDILEVGRADAILSVDGVDIASPILVPLHHIGAVALIGLDVFSQCRFTYADGQFSLEKV